MIITRACTNYNLEPLNLCRYSLNNANLFPMVHNLLDMEIMFYSSSLALLLCFAHRGGQKDVFQPSPSIQSSNQMFQERSAVCC